MKNNKLFIISIFLWCFITIVRILNHVPWFDEAHAWTIAEQLNLFQIFELMKVEGHTFIWYLLLMPFAKFHIAYPYSMQFLNWIFCLIALIILWEKAPFNNLIKIFITFSFPFTYVYSVYARCYSIGLVLLFLLTVLYENKTNRPILYSLLIILCANTSAMALIGSVGFGILFLYDFIKSKQKIPNIIGVVTILSIGSILIGLQVLGVDSTAISDYRGINLPHSDLIKIFCVSFILFIVCVVPLILFLWKNKKILFFFIFTVLAMSYCFIFKYYGHYWNHSFYWIYFMISVWLGLLQNNSSIKFKKFILTVFTVISFIHIFIPNFVKDVCLNLTYNDYASEVVRLILKDKNFDKKTIILANDNFAGYILLPYKRNNIINYCEDKPFDYNVVNYPANNKLCYEHKIQNNRFFNEYYTYLDKNRLIKLIKDNASDDDFVYSAVQINEKVFKNSNITYIKDDKTGDFYSIEKYKCVKNMKNEDFCLYKVRKKI